MLIKWGGLAGPTVRRPPGTSCNSHSTSCLLDEIRLVYTNTLFRRCRKYIRSIRMPVVPTTPLTCMDENRYLTCWLNTRWTTLRLTLATAARYHFVSDMTDNKSNTSTYVTPNSPLRYPMSQMWACFVGTRAQTPTTLKRPRPLHTIDIGSEAWQPMTSPCIMMATDSRL